MSYPSGVPPKQQYDQFQGQQQFKSADKATPRNGHGQTTESIPADGNRQGNKPIGASLNFETYIALKTIERVKAGEIKNEVPVKDGGEILSVDFPEVPVLLPAEVYETPTGWANNWKPEQLEKIYPELFIRDQKAGRDHKRSIRDFRRHTETLPSEDEIWYAKDIPIMHQLSCLNSKKNRNCMGCSPFWKTVQGIQEELKPWGNHDLLHYEPEHSETFVGHITMNGSFTPQQKEMLACDSVNTLVDFPFDFKLISVVLFGRP